MIQDFKYFSFDRKNNVGNIIFAFYVVFLCLTYLIAWKLFLDDITEELWRAKALLSIIPTDVLMENNNTRQYILENSTAAHFSKKS